MIVISYRNKFRVSTVNKAVFEYNNSFQNHLAKIEFAKRRAIEIFAEFGVTTETAMASLSRAWEMLFESLGTNNDGSIKELKDISDVIQKLSSSHQKIQEIELKKIENLKRAESDEGKKKRQVTCGNFQNKQLSSEIVAMVEEQLQLL